MPDQPRWRWLPLGALVVLVAFWLVRTPAELELRPATIDGQATVIEQDNERLDTVYMPAVQPGTSASGADRFPDEAAAGELDDASIEVGRDRDFISYAFPLLSTWDVAVVKPLLSKYAIDASTDAELQEVMTVLAGRLGKLQYFELPRPASFAEVGQAANGVAGLQPYRFMAWYQAGPAEVSVVLHRQYRTSSLHSFNINIPNQGSSGRRMARSE